MERERVGLSRVDVPAKRAVTPKRAMVIALKLGMMAVTVTF